MNPAERLRAVARRERDDHALAIEAADALAAFARDPASLVVACRRMLAHHRAHGALWWVCARILAGADAAAAARESVRLLEADRTADRLAATLPLVDENQVVAVVGWPYAVDQALAERIDVPAVAIVVDGADPTPALRRRAGERGVRVDDPWSASTRSIARLLVPALALGAGCAMVPAGTAGALDVLRLASDEIWLVGGVGRALPRRMFEAARVAATTALDTYDDPDDPSPEVVPLTRFDRVIGPRGLQSPAEAEASSDCPTVPELLRPL